MVIKEIPEEWEKFDVIIGEHRTFKTLKELKLSKILKKLSVDDEFEVMFGGYNKINSLKLDQFLEIIKYLKNYADEKKLKLEHHETLDIL